MHKKLFLYTILRELSWTSRNIILSLLCLKHHYFWVIKTNLEQILQLWSYQRRSTDFFFLKKKKVWKIEVAFLLPLTSLEPGCDQCPTDSRASLLCSDEGLYHQNFECLSAKALSIFLSVCSSVFWKNSQQWQVISSRIWSFQVYYFLKYVSYFFHPVA